MRPLNERLAACYTGAVHDVLRMMGHERVVLPHDHQAARPDAQARRAGVDGLGPHRPHEDARTRRCSAGARCCRRRPPATSWSASPNNREVALMGELSAQTLAARGVLGYVVDGGSRDTALVLEQGFPVWCSFLTPSDIVERWIPDAYGAPIDIGGVTIATGDCLLADRDGVVIVPKAIAEEAVRRTEEVMSTESDMRRALVGGMDPVEAYNTYGKF